jgi:hypothetical protein
MNLITVKEQKKSQKTYKFFIHWLFTNFAGLFDRWSYA